MQRKRIKLPFDISSNRVIFYDFDVEIVENSSAQLKNQIQSIEQTNEYYKAISTAHAINNLQSSGDETRESIAEILIGIRELKKDTITKDCD